MFRHQLPNRSGPPEMTGAELRLFEAGHAAVLFALIDTNRTYLRQWVPCLNDIRTIHDAGSLIAAARAQTVAGSPMAGVWYRAALVGMVGFNALDPANRAAEIGYWLGAGYQGRGLMTWAVRMLVDHAFTDLQLQRLVALCAVGNTRSAAVVRRLGFTCESVIREGEWLFDHYVDDELYVMHAPAWRQLHPRTCLMPALSLSV